LVKADIDFLKQCLKSEIYPKFMDIRETVRNDRSAKAVKSAKKTWLMEEIRYHHGRIDRMNLELYDLHLTLTKMNTTNLAQECWLNETRNFEEVLEHKLIQKKRRLQQKFRRLKNFSRRPTTNTSSSIIPDMVHNLSGVEFTQGEMELLNKGLNFVETPKIPPLEEIIVGVECALRSVPFEERLAVRSLCKVAVKQGMKCNPSPHKKNEITSIGRKGCILLKADKGDAIVILTKEQYRNNMNTMLEEGPYELVKRSPLNRRIKEVNEELHRIKDEFDVNLLHLRNSNPTIPKLYGLPKVHKPGNKMRPISSNNNATTEKIAKWLSNEFKGLPDPPGQWVKNTFEFVERVKDVVLEGDELLVSFDVTALYPNVPIPAAMKHLNVWLKSIGLERSKVTMYMKLAELCMKENTFQFEGKFYEQTFGTSMGNALSPFVANLFMGVFEQKLKRRKLFPKLWVRYVDDVFAIVHKDKIEDLMSLLNAQCPSIKFTCEIEKEGVLPFLDVEVRRTEDNQLQFKVFRKPTNTQRFIVNESHHSRQHKMSAFNSMMHRAVNIPMNDEDQKAEFAYIYEAAKINGYDDSQIQKLQTKHQNKKLIKQHTTLSPIEKEIPRFASIPFFPSITHRLTRLFSKYNIQMVHTNNQKLKNRLGSPKDKTPTLQKSGIYEITCNGCDSVYVGQTKRNIHKRFKEHMHHVTKNEPMKSSVAHHILQHIGERPHTHTISIDNLRLLQQVDKPWKLNVYESLHIHKHKNAGRTLMNADEGEVNSCLFGLV
jgi:hypothetical protein